MYQTMKQFQQSNTNSLRMKYSNLSIKQRISLFCTCMHSLQYLDISIYQNYILFSLMWPVSRWKKILLESTIPLNIFV